MDAGSEEVLAVPSCQEPACSARAPSVPLRAGSTVAGLGVRCEWAGWEGELCSGGCCSDRGFVAGGWVRGSGWARDAGAASAGSSADAVRSSLVAEEAAGCSGPLLYCNMNVHV